jgi:hypothetical protein
MATYGDEFPDAASVRLAGGETMGLPWTVPLLLVTAAILLALVPFGRRLFSGTYVSRRAFWCPFRRTNVSVDFRTATWDGAFLDVNACSEVPPPLACSKDCLQLPAFPAVKS